MLLEQSRDRVLTSIAEQLRNLLHTAVDQNFIHGLLFNGQVNTWWNHSTVLTWSKETADTFRRLELVPHLKDERDDFEFIEDQFSDYGSIAWAQEIEPNFLAERPATYFELAFVAEDLKSIFVIDFNCASPKHFMSEVLATFYYMPEGIVNPPDNALPAELKKRLYAYVSDKQIKEAASNESDEKRNLLVAEFKWLGNHLLLLISEDETQYEVRRKNINESQTNSEFYANRHEAEEHFTRLMYNYISASSSSDMMSYIQHDAPFFKE